MSSPTVSLPMLEAYIGRRRTRLTFPKELEELYDQQMDSYREKVMARSVLPAVLVYNVFLIADFLLLPQSAVRATILHLALVTPAIFLAAFLYPRIKKHLYREILRSAIRERHEHPVLRSGYSLARLAVCWARSATGWAWTTLMPDFKSGMKTVTIAGWR